MFDEHYPGSVIQLPTPQHHVVQRIEYADLDHFLADIHRNGIAGVHLDALSVFRPTELSFIHYVDLVVYLTAVEESPTVALYEYMETIGSYVVTDRHEIDTALAEQGRLRMESLRDQLEASGLLVEHGRITEVLWTSH